MKKYNNIIVDDFNFAIPKEVEHIENYILNTKHLLYLKDGWDDEGGKIVPKNLWYNVMNFLLNINSKIYSDYKLLINEPSILPCPDGSLDLCWDNNKARILINFRNLDTMEAYYYGDLYTIESKIKGNFIGDSFNNEILHFITNFKKL